MATERKPTAYIFGVGDTRFAPEHWITPHHLDGLERAGQQFSEAGFECRVIQAPLLQSQHQASMAMMFVEKNVKEGDVLVLLCTGWGLPGIYEAAIKRLREPILAGTLKVHLHSNLLAEYPGFVLGSAAALILAEMGVPFTRSIVLDWNDPKHIRELEQLRTEGIITRDYGDQGPGEVAVTGTDRDIAREVLRRMASTIYAQIGMASMQMQQSYPNRQLLGQLGVNLLDIGPNEFYTAADSVQLWRAKNAMRFCTDHGLEINPDVSEPIFLRQMQYLLAWHALRDRYGFNFMGYQGQFDMTAFKPGEPAEDFALAAMNSRCRPESDGMAMVAATERDFFGAITMKILQTCVDVMYRIPGDSVGFHDLRHTVRHLIANPGTPGEVREWLIVWLNSGALNFRDLTGRDDTMEGVRAMSQNAGYFQYGGAASAGEMVPVGQIAYKEALDDGAKIPTFARLICTGWSGFSLQAGCGDIVGISQDDRYSLYGNLDRQWPFGLFKPWCSSWRLLYEHVGNHMHHVPLYVLPVLAAICEIMDWEFRPLGATRPKTVRYLTEGSSGHP